MGTPTEDEIAVFEANTLSKVDFGVTSVTITVREVSDEEGETIQKG